MFHPRRKARLNDTMGFQCLGKRRLRMSKLALDGLPSKQPFSPPSSPVMRKDHASYNCDCPEAPDKGLLQHRA
uniref:Uncharacterized protein n=1 Tax=Panagrellus redivivus TaxID=6233 RepID=A0A7E4W766_PANRE